MTDRPTNGELLARIDERTSAMSGKIDHLENSLRNKADKKEVDAIKDTLGDFTLLVRFKPVEMLVYGAVALVLTAVVGALIGTVVIK